MNVQLLDVEELLSLPPQRWLIQDVLPEGDYSVLWGPTEQGKSFIALDMAASIALGRPWLGVFPTMKSPVVYIAAEGGSGMMKRVEALMVHYGVTDIPGLYFMVKPLYVREEDDLNEFMQALEDLDMWPGLIIIDTLSRSFGGGEENASADMGFFVAAITHLANERASTVMVIHHANAVGNRERGHTSLKSGAQAMLQCKADMTKDGHIIGIRIITGKQKDAAHEGDIYVDVKPLEDSLVIELGHLPEKPEKGGKKEPAPMRKVDMLTVLGGHAEGMTFNEWMYASAVPKTTFRRRLNALTKSGDVYREGGQYFATPTTKDLASAEVEAEEA
jgi:AAA domain